MNLASALETSAVNFAHKTAIAMGECRITFEELNANANRVARALLKMGLKKGDRVATLQGSNPEFAAVFFGILKAGCIAVPLDSRYVADELVSLFDDCTPRVLVAEDIPLQSLLPEYTRLTSIEHTIVFSPVEKSGFTLYEDILAGPDDNPGISINPDDICIISYTGGPTFNPHGVMLSHGAVCEEALDSADILQQTGDDVLIQFALPTYHQFGLTGVLLASIIRGNTVVSVPGTGRSIHSFMEAVEREKGTMYMGVPYIYSLMINVARREGIRHDLSSLRLCASAGAPLEPAVIRLFRQYFNKPLIDMFGQTESVCQVTVMPLDGSGPAGSSGRIIPRWKMKIFDENDNELPAGRTGELVLRGPYMSGFYKQTARTEQVLRNGWLHTGDLGHIDEDGFLFITGRKRRVIILKGQNVFPSDIETVLLTHPSVAEARVMGIADLVRGETIKALVRPATGAEVTEQELRQYCQGKMADYKLPKDIIIVNEIPLEIPIWQRPPDSGQTDIRL